MKRSGRSTRIELPITTHSLGRRQRLDLDTALPQLVERLRVGTQLPVRTGAHEQALGQLAEDIVEVGKNEAVPFCAPPVGEDAVGKDDHVTRLLRAVDADAAEAVVVDPVHREPEPGLEPGADGLQIRCSTS